MLPLRVSSNTVNESMRVFLTQILEYYRSPLKYPHLVDVSNPLPKELPGLLKMLNASSNSGAGLHASAEQLGVHEAELSHAAFFYIKQALFVIDADYYRVLGLSENVLSEQISRHYRMLIGLFHPDKNPGGENWDELYATRINEAYNTLKRPEKRKIYDSQKGTAKQVYSGERKHAKHAVRKQLSKKPIKSRAEALHSRHGLHFWHKNPKAAVIVIIVTGLLLVLLMLTVSDEDPALEMSEGVRILPSGELHNKPVDERHEAFMRAIKGNTFTKEGGSENNSPMPETNRRRSIPPYTQTNKQDEL